MMRAALYIRVSTQEQAEKGYSIQAQKHTLIEYCKSQGFNDYQVYVDEGISGTSTNKRIALQRLLEDAEQQHFQGVFVWKINRLVRNLVDLLSIVERLEKYNVSLKSVSEQFETTTPQGRFILTMMGAVGQLERETIVDNTKLGRQQRNKEGWYCGARILGYDVITKEVCIQEELETNLKVNKQEAVIVKEIFELFASGKGYKAIVNQLNKKGVRTKTGKLFTIGVVCKILKNPVYIGNITCKIDDRAFVINGRHPAIISNELWENVQQKRGNKKMRSTEPRHRYPLNSFLKCPMCQKSMKGTRVVAKRKNGDKKVYDYYQCLGYLNGGIGSCYPNLIPALEIELEVYKVLQNFLHQPTIVKDVFSRINEPSSKQKENMVLFNTVKLQLERLIKKKKKLLFHFEEGLVSNEDFLQEIERISEDITVVQDRVRSVEHELKRCKDVTLSKVQVRNMLRNFVSLLNESNKEDMDKLFSSFLHQVEVSKEHKLKLVSLKINEYVIQVVEKKEGKQRWKIS